MSLTLGELAGQIRGELQTGDPDCRISAVATLQHAGAGDISFLANPGYKKYLQDTRASAVIQRIVRWRLLFQPTPMRAMREQLP